VLTTPLLDVLLVELAGRVPALDVHLGLETTHEVLFGLERLLVDTAAESAQRRRLILERK